MFRAELHGRCSQELIPSNDLFWNERQKHVVASGGWHLAATHDDHAGLASFRRKFPHKFCIPHEQQSETGNWALLHMFLVSKTKSKVTEAKKAAVSQEQEA